MMIQLSALPFGIDWLKILLHLINFALLAVGLFFLLYKPVKKFMDKRKEEIEGEIEKGERLQKEAQEIKEAYEIKLTEAEEESERIKTEAFENANKERERIISEANAEARAVKEDADRELEELKRDTIAQAKDELADVALKIADEVIGREVSREDNKRIVDECLEEWSNKR